MHSIITSYLAQTGKCKLPYLGTFITDYKPAIINETDKQILPPVEEIVFNEETDLLSPGLVNYIAVKKNTTGTEAQQQIEIFCKYWKEKIEDGEKLSFNSLGHLHKNKSGNICFTREDSPEFLKVVSAEPVLIHNIQEPVLIDDHVITSSHVNEYPQKIQVTKKPRWIMASLVLAVIALVGLFYNLYKHGGSTSAIGNQNKFTIKAAEKTYIEVK